MTKSINRADSFIEHLGNQALSSTAVNHPYLDAIVRGDFPNIQLTLKDFAFQYGFYSKQFIDYMSSVTHQLKSAKHRRVLESNLAEEEGDTHGVELSSDVLASVTGESHANLFQRFQKALGIEDNSLAGIDSASSSQINPGQIWSEKFLKLCQMDECVGIGAIGLGTELIVSRIYSQLLKGLKAHSNLTVIQRVFFDLHSECDDEHAAQMLLIAKDLAQDKTSCEQIEYGVNTAIKIRSEFWDKMLERAQSFTVSTSSTNQKLSSLEY